MNVEKKIIIIIYKLRIPTTWKALAFSVFDIRVWGPVLSCLKMIGIANIFSPFSFLKPPPTSFISAPLSHSFCCYIPLPILQFRVKAGIMQEVMGCGSEREEIRMLLDSHPFLLRSRAKQFQRKCRYRQARELRGKWLNICGQFSIFPAPLNRIYCPSPPGEILLGSAGLGAESGPATTSIH